MTSLAAKARSAVDPSAPGGEVAKEEMVLTRRFLEGCGKGDLEALKAFLFEELDESAAPLRAKKTRDATGKTAMHFAAAAGQAKTCSFLYHLVADRLGVDPAKELVNAVDADGSTPLSLCVAAAPDETVLATTQTLLDVGANLCLTNNRGVAPIHRAAGEGHCDVISLLLERASGTPSDQKKMLNLMSHETGSPLHWAAGEKRVEAVRLLACDLGATLDVPNSAGLSPFFSRRLSVAVTPSRCAGAVASLTVELPGASTCCMCAEMSDAAQAAAGVRACYLPWRPEGGCTAPS